MKPKVLLASAREPGSRALLVALALLAAALVLPGLDLPRSTWDTLVVFDITQSMNVEDYELAGAPASRLHYARAAARRALRELPCGSRVGWGAFAEYRSLLLVEPIEVCANYADLLASLERIDGRMRWSNASEISKGLFWALRAAKDVAGAPNLIFITDGQEAPPLGPEGQALFDDIKPGEIRGWIMGAGGDVPRPIPRTDEDGRHIGFWNAEDVTHTDTTREHLSSLREAHLQGLARQTGLSYARMAGSGALSDAMRDPGLARIRPVASDLSSLPLSLALIVLALRFWPGAQGVGRVGEWVRSVFAAWILRRTPSAYAKSGTIGHAEGKPDERP